MGIQHIFIGMHHTSMSMQHTSIWMQHTSMGMQHTYMGLQHTNMWTQHTSMGLQRGHGRVVFLYFDLCEHIWGGSPATEQILSGVESIDINQEVATSSTDTCTAVSGGSNVDEDEQSVQGKDSSPIMQQRQELLGAQLSNYKQEKLKRKLPVDGQLLNCAKEDLHLKKKQLKKKLIDQMDQLHNEDMTKLNTNMENLTNSITSGFALLQN